LPKTPNETFVISFFTRCLLVSVVCSSPASSRPRWDHSVPR
jgi:hypothetical protein